MPLFMPLVCPLFTSLFTPIHLPIHLARATRVKNQVPRQISFMTTVQIFNEGVLKLIPLTGKILKHAINGLLSAIASIPIGQQKRKTQPRAIKRRPKSYPLLNEPRDQACEAINI